MSQAREGVEGQNAGGASSNEKQATFQKRYAADPRLRTQVDLFWFKLSFKERKRGIASIFIESFLKDLFNGNVDLLLHELYTTNHTNSPELGNITDTFKYIFRILIYQDIKFQARSDGSFSLFDGGDDTWWIIPKVMSDHTKIFLKQLMHPDYLAFKRTVVGGGGLGSTITTWSEFEFDYIIRNALLTTRAFDTESSIATASILSPRSHLGERMIMLMILINIAFTKIDVTQPGQLPQALHIFRMSSNYLNASLQEIAVEKVFSDTARQSFYLPVTPKIAGMRDDHSAVHLYLIELLEDESRLLRGVNRLATRLRSDLAIATNSAHLAPSKRVLPLLEDVERR